MWVMLHSGSRGVGNRIGSYFIERAKAEMRRWFINLPDQDLAYLPEGSELFDDYLAGGRRGRRTTRATNRELMMHATIDALRATQLLPAFTAHLEAVNCHHNYVSREHHYGENVIVTRKGAVRARAGRARHHPGLAWARSRSSCAARATRSRSRAAATARAAR